MWNRAGVIQYCVTTVTRWISAIFEWRSDRRDSFRQDGQTTINNARATAKELEKSKPIAGSQNQLARIDQPKIRHSPGSSWTTVLAGENLTAAARPEKTFRFGVMR